MIVNLAYANLAREVWLEAKLDPYVPTFTTIMQCSAVQCSAVQYKHGRRIRSGRNARGTRAALALVGGVESMSRVQIGLAQNLSDWLRRVVQARSVTQRISLLRKLRPSDIRLFVPQVKNRGRSCRVAVPAPIGEGSRARSR
jgi:acetyl-CoA C-acetyltransferase